jgi:phosphohistidine swiveling domain-containing protein
MAISGTQNINKLNLQNLHWVVEVKRRGSVLGMHYLCYGMNKYTPYVFGVPFVYHNVLYLDSYLYKVQEEDAELKAKLREAFEKDHNYFLGIASRIRADGTVIRSYIQEFLNRNSVKNTEQKEVQLLFETYISMLSHFGTYFRFMEPSRVTLEALTAETLGKKLGSLSEVPEALLTLSISNEQDYVTRERRSLLSIAALGDKNLGRSLRGTLDIGEFVECFLAENTLRSKLEEHVSDFSWMGTADHLGTPFTAKQYVEIIHQLEIDDVDFELKRLGENDLMLRAHAQQLIEKLKLSNRDTLLIKSIQEYDYIDSFIKETVLSSQVKAGHLLGRIARILGIELESLLSLTFEEVIYCMKEPLLFGEELVRKVEERKKDWGMVISGSNISIFSGKDLNLLQRKIQKTSYDDIFEVVGAPANIGKVTAIARIINTVEEFDKIQQGDIIVTSMTTPEYSAVMEKISGIITDEGGVTSHAASIAREKGVPCLVGTKIATKVFADGDEIELDSESGIARKLFNSAKNPKKDMNVEIVNDIKETQEMKTEKWIVMIMDDTPDQRKNLKDAFIRKGLKSENILCAMDVVDANEKFRDQKKLGKIPDIIIVDVWIRGDYLGGVKFVEEIKRTQNYPSNKLVIYSNLLWDKSSIPLELRIEGVKRLKVVDVSEEIGNLVAKQEAGIDVLVDKVLAILEKRESETRRNAK